MNPRSSARFSWFARAIASFLVVVLACAPAPRLVLAQNLPDLGDESATELSPAMERRLGEGYFRELRRDPDFLDDPEVTNYVQELGNKLIASSPEPTLEVEFFMVKDNSINAFAMLGGFIGVNTGLLIAAQSESEAASVIGHEMGHLIQKHIARSVSAGKKASIASLVAMLGCVLAARSNPQFTQACLIGGSAVPIAQQLAYSRDFEREADRMGFDILQRGGFDVSAMPAFFERLQRAGRVYDSNAPAYVRTHPLTTERIADVRNRAQNVPYRQHADSLAFALVRAKLRATMDASVDGRRDTLKFFSSQIADKTYANLTAAHYGYAWALLLSKEYARAEAELALIPKALNHPMIENLAGSLLLARKDLPGAIKTYRAAVARFPNSRPLQLSLIEALQQAGQHAEALSMLRDQAERHGKDPKVYELEVKSYGATGKRMLQHQAQAENHVLLGLLQPAINELMVARCTGEGDFYQNSIIDARIRTLWEQLAEEKRDKDKADGNKDDKSGDKPLTRPLPRMGDRPPEARC